MPNTSGDSWLPQVAVDAQNRVWVVWSQQVNGNWDIYARRFDPQKQEWGALERLTSDPLPDINPRLASNGKGQFALVWQGFRGKNSNIFLKTFDGEKWSAEVRVTNRAANDWEPAVAIDSAGHSLGRLRQLQERQLRRVRDARCAAARSAAEIAVAATPRFEARATVAVDTADRVWVAWEAGQPNWGKDNGYVIRDRQPGVPLGGVRDAQIRCYDGGQWKKPAASLDGRFPGGSAYQPHVFSDGRGSVWVAAKIAHELPARSRWRPPKPAAGYWEYWVTHLDGDVWSQACRRCRTARAAPARASTPPSRKDGDAVAGLAHRQSHRASSIIVRCARQVYAGLDRRAARPQASRAGAPPRTKPVEAKAGHADEAGDLRAIRAYTAHDRRQAASHRARRLPSPHRAELGWRRHATTASCRISIAT